MRVNSQRGSVFMRMVIYVGIAVIVLLLVQGRSIGTLHIINSGSASSPYQISIHAIDPDTSRMISEMQLPAGSLAPGGEINLPLEGAYWRVVKLEVWDTYKNIPFPGDSPTFLVLPGGLTMDACLANGKDLKEWKISSWGRE